MPSDSRLGDLKHKTFFGLSKFCWGLGLKAEQELSKGSSDFGSGGRSRSRTRWGQEGRGVCRVLGFVIDASIRTHWQYMGCEAGGRGWAWSRWGRMGYLVTLERPWMCLGFGFKSFKGLHFIICVDIILINPHVVQVRVPLPFDQILQLFAPAKLWRVQNLLNLIFFFIIDQIGRWALIVGPMHCCLW